MAVRFHNDEFNPAATLYGKPFPPDDIQALWHMWPSVLTLRWYRGLGWFELVDHEFGVRRNITPEQAMDYDCWVTNLNTLERERERKRLARATGRVSGV